VSVELSGDVLRAALAALKRRDAERAGAAEEAFGWLAWRESDDEPLFFGQRSLQTFLWYVLPSKWDAPEGELVAVAHALGDLLEAAGAPDHYVALCRSRDTERLLRSGGDGFDELMESSGLEPPDTPLLEWGDIMTLEESEEREAASLYLEAAIDEGRLEPGATGWRERQREVTEVFLLTADEGGSSPLERVGAARIAYWLGPADGAGGLDDDRRSLCSALLPLLEQEPDAEAASLALDPLLWLLDRCADGARLTATNALARRLVQQAVERYPAWWLRELGTPPHREMDVRPLELLHDFAFELRLVRRRRDELVLTRRGRELRADPRALLRLVARELADGIDSEDELALALIAAGRDTESPDVPMLAAMGVAWLLHPFAGFTNRIWEETSPTEGGKTLALAILRACATGPTRIVWQRRA
jgi:hypothetical protein